MRKLIFDAVLRLLGVYDDYYRSAVEQVILPTDNPPVLGKSIADTHRNNRRVERSHRNMKTIRCAVCNEEFQVPKTSRNVGCCTEECKIKWELDRFTV